MMISHHRAFKNRECFVALNTCNLPYRMSPCRHEVLLSLLLTPPLTPCVDTNLARFFTLISRLPVCFASFYRFDRTSIFFTSLTMGIILQSDEHKLG